MIFKLYTLVLWSIFDVMKNRKSTHKSGLSASPSRTFSEGLVRRSQGISAIRLFIKARKQFFVEEKIHWIYCGGISYSRSTFLHVRGIVVVDTLGAQGRRLDDP